MSMTVSLIEAKLEDLATSEPAVMEEKDERVMPGRAYRM